MKNLTQRIIFMHFPYNTYENDIDRKNRSISFFRDFKSVEAIIIPPQNIPKIYRTSVSSHFERTPQYAAYAGMIRALTTLN